MSSDIEMGERGGGGQEEQGEERMQEGQSANPLHEKKERERVTSETKFMQHAEEQAREAARKGLGTGANANQQAQAGVNAEALGRVMSGGMGGMELERLNIAINWLQNVGLVMIIDVPWPESFKKWFRWVEMLGLDFDVFGGMGESVSIALGLLVPVWLIYEFDAGLFWERTYFGHRFESKSELFITAGLTSVIAVVLSFRIVAKGWITSSLTNAFILVLSGLSLLSFLHQVYLWRETKVCESAKEDFAKKRQENQMFFFLFLYTVAYLSGGESLRGCGGELLDVVANTFF